MYGECSVVTAK